MTFEDYWGEEKLVAHSFALWQNALRYGTKWFQNCSDLRRNATWVFEIEKPGVSLLDSLASFFYTSLTQ